MPRLTTKQNSETVHLWVKQGKTEHMATLVDSAVLSKIKEKREESKASSSSFSLTSLSLLDLVASAANYVEIRWDSTSTTEFIDPSTIRFRDLLNEGRGSSRSRASRRRSRPSVLETLPPAKRVTPAPSPAPARKKRKIARVSATAYREGRDDDSDSGKHTVSSHNSLHSSVTKTSKSGIGNATSNDNVPADRHKTAAQDTSIEGTKQIPSAQNTRNVIDMNDFDSSDDEAVEYRMKLNQQRNSLVKPEVPQNKFSASKRLTGSRGLQIVRDATRGTGKWRHRSQKHSEGESQTDNDTKSNRTSNSKKKRRRSSLSSGGDSGFSDSACTSGSFFTEASSRKGIEDRIHATGAKTNTSNWTKMKQYLMGGNYV